MSLVVVVMRSLGCQGCVTVPSVLTNYLHSVLYHFPSNAATLLRIFRVSRQFANTRQKNAANPVTGAFASYLLCICTID